MTTDNQHLAIDRVQELFFEEYGTMPSVTARSPGRVNLIGEHTDYNVKRTLRYNLCAHQLD